MRRESWCWEAPLTMMMMSVSLAVAMDPASSSSSLSMAVAVGDSPILTCPLYDAIAWMKGTDGIIFVNEKYVGRKPLQYKYGLTVITPMPSPGLATPQPQNGPSGQTRPQQNNQYHLNIRKTSLGDAGTYQCQNSEGKKVRTSLSVIGRPRCNPVRLPNVLKEGDKLFFTCTVMASGARLPAVYWTKGSLADLGKLKMPERKPIRDPLLVPVNDVATVANQLQFKVTYQDNGLNLSCSATHKDWKRPSTGPEATDKLSCAVGTLNVLFKPKLICDEKQIFQPDSKEFYVYCDVLANPWSQVEQYSWRVYFNESSPGLKPEHHPNFTVKEYYLVRESGIRTRVHIIHRDVARDGLVFLLQVFSTSGNMEKRITLHIPNEFPFLWAAIGGGLGAALVCILCFVYCVYCRKNSDEYDGKSEKDFYPGSSEMDGGNNFFSAKNAPERQSKRARADSQFDSEGSSRLGRESKRKIVLTHPIEVEGETVIADISALHDTPPNVNQQQQHQYHVKSKVPKDLRSDNNNKPSPQQQQLHDHDQQNLHQQQSRALIHADERKATTTHAGHTPRSDRRRRERKNRTDRSGSEETRSIEAFEIEDHPEPDGSYDPDNAQHHHNFQHHRFKGGDASERPVPPPRPRSTLDTSGLSSMHSPSSHSHDSLRKLNMESVQEELKRKLTSPQLESLRSLEASSPTVIPPPLIVDAEISPTPHDIIAPTPVHHNHPLAPSTGLAPEDKYRLVDKYFPPPKTTDILGEDASKKPASSADVKSPPPLPLFKSHPGEKPSPSPKPHFQNILQQQQQQQPPSSAFTPIPNFYHQQQGSSSSSSSPSKQQRPARAFYATPKGPAPPIPHHKSAFHQPQASTSLGSNNGDQPEHPPPPSFSPQMSLSSGYASKAGSYQSEC